MRRVALVAGAVLVVAVAAFVAWPRGATPVAHDDAVEQFRRQSTTSNPDERDSTPPPGAYRFAATGEETVKLAVLPSATRTLAASVTGVVVDVATPDGSTGRCFELTMLLFTEHTERTTVCADDAGVTLGGHTKEQSIGALSPVAEVACAPRLIVDLAEDAPTGPHPLKCSMTVDGGPAAITVELSGTAAQSDPEDLEVDGESVETIPVEISLTAAGGLSGTWVERWWLSTEHWLPVRMERRLDLQGPASFVESSSFQLEDLVPTT